MLSSLFNHNDKTVVSISPSIIVFTVFFLLGLYFLWFIQSVLTLLILAFIIAVALAPVARKLRLLLKVNEFVAIALTYGLLIISVSIILAIMLPPLTKELGEILTLFNLPALTTFISEFKFSLSEIGNFAERVSGSVGTILVIITSTFSGIFTTFTLFVISFYILVERKKLHTKISWITTKPAHLERLRKCLDSIEEQLGGWVRAEISLMTTIGLVTYAGLLIFQVPYALPLAVLAGLLEILPNLGPTIAAVPAVIIAFITQGWLVAVSVLIMCLLIQQVENNFLVPRVMSDRVHIDPLAVIVVILIGLELAGVLGALLAVPVYIIARTVYSFYFKDMVRSMR